MSGSTVMAVAGGTCTITATQGGSADYAAATTVTQSLQVTTGQAAQTISFTPPPEAVTPGVPVGEPVDLSASASPDPALPVSFTSDTPQVCTMSGSTVLTAGPGTCTITASQVGSANYAPAPNVQDSFEVYTGRSQTITFGPLPDRPVDTRFHPDRNGELEAAGLVQLQHPTGVHRIGHHHSGFTASTVTTGTCTITASQDGNQFCAPAPDVTQSFTVTKRGQTITFGPLPDAAVKTQFALTATASSELPVSFSSSTQRVCTVSGTTTSGFTASTVTTGTCTITATQDGNQFWAPAPDVTQSFTVTKRGQTITFGPLPDRPVHTRFPLTATASSKLRVSFSSSTQRVCTVSGTTTSGFTASTVTTGTCTIAATQGGDEIWAAATPVTQSFTVTKKGQKITFTRPPDSPARTQVPLHATADPSGLPVSFTSDTTDVCTVTDQTASTVKAGTCIITATQDGDDTWAAATPAKQSFTVTKRAQTITFGPLSDTQVHARVPLTATASSKLRVSFSSSTQRVCTVSGTTTSGFTATTVTAGTCIITATQDGDEIWAAATPVKQSFTVTKAAQKIIFDQPKDTLAGEQVTLSALATSELPVSFTSDTPRVCTISGTTTSGFTATTKAAGTCIITAAQNGNDTWAAATDVQRSFRVIPAGKKSQTIAFAQPSPAAVGQSITLSASASSGLAISFTSSTSAVCTVSGSTVTTVAVGTCVVTASQGGNADYAAARDVARSFQVNQAGQKPQTITFTPPTGTKVGEPVTLSASASSGLLVSFASNTPAVCTVAGSTATQVAAGTCAITASQSGNASYAPARDVARSFQVNPAGPKVHPARHKSQTITFTPPPGTTVGEPVTLSASASSGLPVSFASSTPAVCTVSGSTVTTMVAGACMITASQGGNASYAPAQDVTQSFQVNPPGPKVHTGHKPQTINFDPPSQTKAGDPVALSASASSGLPVVFTSDTPPVCTVSGSTVITTAAGACTVTASQDGSADYAAAPTETRSFQVDPASSTWTGPLVFLLAGAVMTAAGVAAGVRRLRLRSRRALVRAPSVRAVPEAGPPGQVDVQNTGPTATRTVRIESSPGTSITTIEEARP